MSAYTWVPVVNLILGGIGFGWLWFRTMTRKEEYPTEVLLTLYLTLALFFSLLFVSAQMIVLANAPLASTIMISVVKVYALYVLWRTRKTKFRTGTRRADGNPGADENRDVDAPRPPR